MPPKKNKKVEMVMDAMGNSVPKGSRTDPEVVAERAAAAARREAKAALAAAAKEEDEEADSKDPGDVGLSSGGKEKKLTRNEKKRLEREAKMAAAEEAESAVRDDVLGQFSLNFDGRGGEDGPSQNQHPNDVVVEGLTIAAPSRTLLSQATLKLFKDRRYGLLGNNGSGKSTLLRFIAERPSRLPVPKDLDVLLVEQEISASEVSVVDQVLAADTARTALLEEERTLWSAVGGEDGEDDAINEQTKDWTDAQWASALERLAELGKQIADSGADAAEGKVCRILSGLGFTRAMQAAGTTTLSGGWRMRVSLARALFREPALLLLDEPSNHLDLNAVLWLEDHLAKRFKGTLLVVSHDADFLDTVCTDLIDLDNKALEYYGGDVYKFLRGRDSRDAKRASDYTLQEKTMKAHLAKGLAKKVAEKKTLETIKRGALVEKPQEYKVNFCFKSPGDNQPTIAVLGAGFGHKGGPKLFNKLECSIGTHSRIAVVGPNGAGKTTFLQLLTGKLKPTSGEISLHSKLRLGRFDQHFEELLPLDQTPVVFLRSEFKLTEQEARKSLGQFGLDGPRHLIRISELSGGQKARVVFAMLSLQRPHVLILDEPTNHLDMDSVEALVKGVKEFEGGVVMVSHDARLIQDSECEVWVCEGASNVKAGGTGLRVENRGFSRYRSDILTAIAEAAAVEEKRALLRAETARKKAMARMQKLQKLRAEQK